jgi:hypothetical protein
MASEHPQVDPAHRDRFVWHQDEFDEAVELGSQLPSKLKTGHGEVVEVSRLEHGGVRLSVQAAAARVELTLSADEARALAGQLLGRELVADGSEPGRGV